MLDREIFRASQIDPKIAFDKTVGAAVSWCGKRPDMQEAGKSLTSAAKRSSRLGLMMESAMRNRHPGQCLDCGKLVKTGEGYFQRMPSRWGVRHVLCTALSRQKHGMGLSGAQREALQAAGRAALASAQGGEDG